jgi:gluconokinase
MVIILMGPTGAGKTTVGEILSRELGWEFADADNFHSPANVEKMSKGIALTDADRKPWLDALRAKISQWIARGASGILACSALKKVYRDELSVGPEVKWVYLKGTLEEISGRVAARKGHYAKADLVASQFAALEEPSDAIAIDVAPAPEQIAAEIRRRLGL